MQDDTDDPRCENCGRQYQPSQIRQDIDRREESTPRSWSTRNGLCPECAPDCRRPLDPDRLPEAADYLQRDENLREMLRTALSEPCLYYPGAGRDVDPALLFASSGAVSTVVYVDYLGKSLLHDFGIFFEEFERASGQTQFQDREVHDGDQRPVWRMEKTGDITAADMGFSSPEAFFPNTHTWGDQERQDQTEASLIGRWGRFHDRCGTAKPLMFIYLFTEAIQTYINLWGIHDKAPLAVVVQNHSKGCLWTLLHGDCLLYAAAPRLPKYLYVGNLGSTPWPGYRQVSRHRTDHNSLHRSERALFESRSLFAINPNSPLAHWDGRGTSIRSKRYPDFHVFKLVSPEPSHGSAAPSRRENQLR